MRGFSGNLNLVLTAVSMNKISLSRIKCTLVTNYTQSG